MNTCRRKGCEETADLVALKIADGNPNVKNSEAVTIYLCRKHAEEMVNKMMRLSNGLELKAKK
jgi:hypothetical protein